MIRVGAFVFRRFGVVTLPFWCRLVSLLHDERGENARSRTQRREATPRERPPKRVVLVAFGVVWCRLW